MSLIAWNDRLSVGIASIDKEHQKLVGLVNDFYDAMQAGKGKETLSKVLAELIDYTKTHFANEEQLFAKTGYPDAAEHKKAHDDLTRQVVEIQEKYAKGATTALSVDTLNFLKSWLLTHIQGSDKKYAPHLTGKGIH
ncbi:MAG TPA: bacteriohemerythrin [Terriglobales bacterium]